MSILPENQYVLTQDKFKKAARGLQSRFSELTPGGDRLPLQSVMQALSQELFSMPYEEAKATILIDGSPLIVKKSTSTLNALSDDLPKIATYEENATLLLALEETLPESIIGNINISISIVKMLVCLAGLRRYFPNARFLELKPYEYWIEVIMRQHANMLDGLYQKTKSSLFKDVLAGQEMFEARSVSATTALHRALVQRDLCERLSLRDVEIHLSDLEAFAGFSIYGNLDKPSQAGLLNVLGSVNYAMPSQEHMLPEQSQSTIEMFNYMALEPLCLVKDLLILAEELRRSM